MSANKWLKLDCYCYIAILETIQLCVNNGLTVKGIICITKQFLKPFNNVQKKMSSGSFKNIICKVKWGQ